MPTRVVKENENPFLNFSTAELTSVKEFFNSKNISFAQPLESLPADEGYDILNTHREDLNLAAAEGNFNLRLGTGDFIREDVIFSFRRAMRSMLPDIPSAGVNDKIFISNSCWYSLDELRRFIVQNDMNNTTKFINPGIRFYFGLIRDTFTDAGGVVRNCLRLTTFLVPTKEMDDGSGNKFNQDELSFTSVAGLSAFDHGDLCPPKCQGATFTNP